MNTHILRKGNGGGTMLRSFPWGFGPDFDHMFSRMFGEHGSGWMTRFPQVDVSETDKEVEVRMDVPGFKPDQLDVQLAGDSLTVTGKQEETKEEKNTTYHVVERRSGNFTRTVALPASVDDKNIEANFADGVLTVRMTKSADAGRTRIPVKG